MGCFSDVVSGWRWSVAWLGGRCGQRLGQVTSMVDDKERVELAEHFVTHRNAIQVPPQHRSQLPIDF